MQQDRRLYDTTSTLECAIDNALMEVNTMMPANIVLYNPVTQTATVQPALKRTLVKDTPSIESRPVIMDVPVIFPRSSAGMIHIPLSVGDPVMLVFAQRSLDDWATAGGEVKVTDVRKHDLTDAVAYAGMYPITEPYVPLPLKPQSLGIYGEKLWIGNPSGGPVTSLPPGTLIVPESELLQVLAKMCQVLSAAQLVSSMGPVQFAPNTIADLGTIQAFLESFK